MGNPLDARRHDAAAAPYRDMRESDGIDASLRLQIPRGACAHAPGEGPVAGRVGRGRRRVSAWRRRSASIARAGTAG